MDIVDFFGSIKTEDIASLLLDNKFKPSEAKLFARLCTTNNALPQGAPTSPVLSNAYLFHLDEFIGASSMAVGAKYSRYADDITISGESRDDVERLMKTVRMHLRADYGLAVADAKTRIASRHGRQVVTGVVVNEDVLPPREFRRRIRAAFHRASMDQSWFETNYSLLAGYIGYLHQFPKLATSTELATYRGLMKPSKDDFRER